MMLNLIIDILTNTLCAPLQGFSNFWKSFLCSKDIVI